MHNAISEALEALELTAKWEKAAYRADDATIRKLLLEKMQWEGADDPEAEVEDTVEECYSDAKPLWESFCFDLSLLRRDALETIIYYASSVTPLEAVKALEAALNYATEEAEQHKVERALKECAIDYLTDVICEAAHRKCYFSNKSQSRYWEIADRKIRLSDHEIPSYYASSDIEITVGRLNPDTHYHLNTPFTADELVAFADRLRELVAGLVAQETQEEADGGDD